MFISSSKFNINIKKFLTRLFIYLIIMSVLTCCVNYLYIKKFHTLDDTDKFKNIPSEIKICNFGSSHGQCAFNYENIRGLTCFNFSLSNQYLSYDLRLLKYYYNNLARGGIAFIVISYQSLFGKPETEGDSFLSKNKSYYKFLDAKYIKLYEPLTAFYVKYFPSLTASEGLLKTILRQHKARGFYENWLKTAEKIDLNKDALSKYNAQIIKHKLDLNGRRIYNQEEIDALYEMIKLLKAKNITPVLITTPFLNEYVETVRKNSPEFFDEFYNLINKICADTGVKYYDYSRDERFQDEHERLKLFRDSDHLNKAGAAKFTEIIFKEIINKN